MSIYIYICIIYIDIYICIYIYISIYIQQPKDLLRGMQSTRSSLALARCGEVGRTCYATLEVQEYDWV